MYRHHPLRTFRTSAACAALLAFGAFPAVTVAADASGSRPNTAVIPELSIGFMERHNEFVEIAKKGDIDVLFLGDSITDWWRHPGRGYTPAAPDFTPRRGGAGAQGNEGLGRGRGAGADNVPADAAAAQAAAVTIPPVAETDIPAVGGN